MKNIKLLLVSSVFVALSAHAEAKSWEVDYANSKLGFTGVQDINPFEGRFKNFTATIDFDPDHPETGTIAVTIDIASATAGNEERDGMLPQADWFDTSKFPQAEFTSSQIRKTGSDSFEARGTLTIKGVSQPVTLPFTLQADGDHWRAQGKTTLTRTDFHIGEGQWSSGDTVKLPVDVTIDLSAKPAP